MTKTKTLADLQLQLQNFLLDKDEDASDITLETPQFSKHERLHIYHTAYRLRLIEALGNDYPALQAHVGDEQFTTIAEAFIAKHPSHHPSLRWFGKKLPDFLRNHETWKAKIELAELAEFEWQQAMAFDAADTTLASMDDLRALLPEQWMTLRLRFHPSVQTMHFFSNAPTLWQSLIHSEASIPVELATESQAWLIWREDLQVLYRSLTQEEAWVFSMFADDKNFADVCEGLCTWFPAEQVPMQAAQYLQHWIGSGLIEEIRTH